MTDTEQLRLEALNLAVRSGIEGDGAVQIAETYFRFLNGNSTKEKTA